MSVRATIAAVFALGYIHGFPVARAADQQACLNSTERGMAVAAHEAIPLGDAIKKLRDRGHKADVVRARLCHRNGHLDYVLTMLTGSGKVVTVTMNAVNGDFTLGP
jgi:uncharacterized membrane protein YkoI